MERTISGQRARPIPNMASSPATQQEMKGKDEDEGGEGGKTKKKRSDHTSIYACIVPCFEVPLQTARVAFLHTPIS